MYLKWIFIMICDKYFLYNTVKSRCVVGLWNYRNANVEIATDYKMHATLFLISRGYYLPSSLRSHILPTLCNITTVLPTILLNIFAYVHVCILLECTYTYIILHYTNISHTDALILAFILSLCMYVCTVVVRMMSNYWLTH